MAMHKKVGVQQVKAQFVFVCVDSKKLNQNRLYKLLDNLLILERQRIREDGHITRFVAFVEGEQTERAVASKVVTDTFDIDGEIARLTFADVEATLREKILHESEAFRKQGMTSTHAPRFLSETKLVAVFGSKRFLLENLHLYLEHEGLLRSLTFDLLKEIACLEVVKNSVHDNNFLHVDVARSEFYSGNVEALGQIVRVQTEGMSNVFSTKEMLGKLR